MNEKTRKAYNIIENKIKERMKISTLSEYKIFQELRKDIMLGKEKILFITFENIINALNQFKKEYKEIKNLDDYYKREYKKKNIVYPKNAFRGLKPYTLKNGLTYNKRIGKIIKINECNEILGFDCETYEGTCKLIANQKNHILNPTFDDCIKFMCYHIDNKNVYRFFFNIDFDISSIFKLYPLDDKINFLDKLSKGIEMNYKNYAFKWIRGKLFTIKNKKRNRNVHFVDLYSFFKLSLNKSAKEYIKNIEKDRIDGKKLNKSLKYWKRNEKAIIQYCIKDCQITQQLAWEVIKGIKKLKLPLSKLLVSPASISKQYYRQDNFLSGLINTPIKIVQIAYDCYFGGRFEIFKKGFFKELILIDITSQYPDFIKDLPDMYNGYWEIKKNIKLPKEKCIGYFKVLVDIPENYHIPTIPIKEGIVKFPVGKMMVWATWFDLDLIRDFIIKIQKSYIFKTNKNNIKSYYKKTVDLFDLKTKIKPNKDEKPMDYRLSKITLNGVYGSFIERQKRYFLDNDGNIQKKIKAGKLFNPIYASQITSYGRWSVLKDIPKEKYKNICAIHTDSLIINDNSILDNLDVGKDLGQWEIEKKGKALILGTGMYQINDLVKTRGIPFKQVKDWFKLFKKYKNKRKIKFIIPHMKKIREALVQDKNVVFLNIMKDIEKIIVPNSDTKRIWLGKIEKFKDLLNNNYNSIPIVFKPKISRKNLKYLDCCNIKEKDKEILKEIIYKNK